MADSNVMLESTQEKGSFFKQIANMFTFKKRRNGNATKNQSIENDISSKIQTDSVNLTNRSSKSASKTSKRNSKKDASEVELQSIAESR